MQIKEKKNDDFEGNGIPEVIVRAERDKNSGITVSRRDHADRERRIISGKIDKAIWSHMQSRAGVSEK
jgi:hypothetical protein